MFDNLPIKFAMSSDGLLYTYEQIFKEQEFNVRLSQVLRVENAIQLVALAEKRIIFIVEKDTGIVKTMTVD